jgi:hypothetical protein
MDQETLQRFSRQLAQWAETAIAGGRLPFRRAEALPSLLTEGGEQHPALVLWINRDSWMAGGVVLLPDGDESAAAEAGRQSALALGLRHFVTWSTRRITFWEECEGNPVPRRHLPAGSERTGSTEGFQRLLLALLEELKLSCVTGAVPPADLSPHYLANLCRATLDGIRPLLEETARVARAEGRISPHLAPPDWARAKGFLTLVRLLALVFFDRLPAGVQPERLEQAMRFALDTLPPGLGQTLAPPSDEEPLPAEAGVRFHQLLRRLTQLQAGTDLPRGALLLELLLNEAAPHLGGFPPPSPPTDAERPLLLLNPDRHLPLPAESVLVAPAPILAASALLRHLRNEPQSQRQAEEPFSLSPPLPLRTILGTLPPGRPPDPEERRRLELGLRTSWPTRRFPLPRTTPGWCWTLLHLGGLLDAGGRLEIALADGWLPTDYGRALLGLLQEEFTLHSVARGENHCLHLQLTRGDIPAAEVRVLAPSGERQLSRSRLRASHPVLLALALELPAGVWSLLETGLLRLPAETSPPSATPETLALFLRSTLGGRLWQTVSGDRPRPPLPSVPAEIARHGLPLPAPAVLDDLAAMAREEGDGAPTAAVDARLSPWLGGEWNLPGTNAGREAPRPGRIPASAAHRDALAERIASAAFVDGLPRFPEQYLYGHFRPELAQFVFSGPLRMGGTFFDRVTLHGPGDERMEVTGEETSRALLLASFSGRSPVHLPVDRQLCRTILDAYTADLQSLRRNLVRLCHQHITDRRAADAMVERIWCSRPLPPWPLPTG